MTTICCDGELEPRDEVRPAVLAHTLHDRVCVCLGSGRDGVGARGAGGDATAAPDRRSPAAATAL